jgi:hypothetical protein
MEVLNITRSAIAGLGAIWILMDPCNRHPSSMEIITPRKSSNSILEFLRQADFQATQNITVDRRHHDVIWSKKIIFNSSRTSTITLTESASSSIILPLLASRNTAQMNLVSANEILCLYPSLTLYGTALSFEGRQMKDDHTKFDAHGVVIESSNELWTKHCRFACPNIWRRTSGMRGMALFQWRHSKKLFLLENDTAQSHFSWTLGNPCRNDNCLYKLKT